MNASISTIAQPIVATPKSPRTRSSHLLPSGALFEYGNIKKASNNIKPKMDHPEKISLHRYDSPVDRPSDKGNTEDADNDGGWAAIHAAFYFRVQNINLNYLHISSPF